MPNNDVNSNSFFRSLRSPQIGWLAGVKRAIYDINRPLRNQLRRSIIDRLGEFANDFFVDFQFTESGFG